MQVRTLTFLEGWRWLGKGFALFRRNPGIVMLLILGCIVLFVIIDHLPFIGWTLATVAIPAFTLLLVSAFREIHAGRTPNLTLLIPPLRTHSKPLIVLGLVNLASQLLALSASSLADGGNYMQIALGLKEVTPEAQQSGEFVAPMQITLLLLLPSFMALWFAPMLSVWRDFPAGKAMFFSLMACIRNWRALLAFFFCIIFWGGIVPGAAQLLLSAILPLSQESLFALVLLPLLLILVPSLLATIYVSYDDIFREEETDIPPSIDERT